jgi:starch-binding outer membrane protein, SusD/RagB family
MWNMPGVITEASKFVTGGVYAGNYALGAQPWTVFANNYGSDEYIYGMESSPTNYPSVNGALASQYKRRVLVSHSPINWRNPFWLADDKRRTEGEMVFTQNGVKYTNKYRDDVGYTDLSPMMRYAEVLLNLAEAYTRQGDVANGLTYLNMVRNRSLADPATQAYVATDFANNVALLEAILYERRIELAMEGRRWPDISRLQQCPHFPIDGIPGKLANGLPAAALFDLELGPYTGPYPVVPVPYSSHLFIWPIPQSEINANPTLAAQQNPGY